MLLVFAEMPKISGKLENVTVAEGQEAKFVVKLAGGKPKPTVKWFKEEEEITTIVETYEVVETEDTITLIIKSAKPENAGNYFAQLLNEAGTISTNKAQLIVNRAFFFFFRVLLIYRSLGYRLFVSFKGFSSEI